MNNVRRIDRNVMYARPFVGDQELADLRLPFSRRGFDKNQDRLPLLTPVLSGER